MSGIISGECVEVQVLKTQLVQVEVMAKIACEFTEWLERQGFQLLYRPGSNEQDERSFEELANDFVKECDGKLR
jgi:hypothetical protein